jgi:hypothetical protein
VLLSLFDSMISPKPTTMLLFMPLVVGALADSEASLPAVGATLAVSSTASGSVLSTSASSSIFPSTLVSSSSGSPTSTLLAVPTETSRSTLPISHYSFTPFPTPAQSAVAGVFPSTDPKNPPPVHSSLKIVPDFAPAWAAAYKKAEAKVRP